MADNVLETVQKLVQDVIAPDVRELKVRVESLEKRMDERFQSLEQTLEARFKMMETRLETMEIVNASNFERILSAISLGKSLGEIAALKEMAPLRERVAVLEQQARSAA